MADEPIIDLAPDPAYDADRCPNCGSRLPSADALVCVACGYDQKSNRVLKTQVGDSPPPPKLKGAKAVLASTLDDEAGEKPAEKPELARAGTIGWRIPTIVGAAAIVSAATLAGVNAEGGRWGVAVLRTLLYAPIWVGLGVIAALATARMQERRVGDVAAVAGRMTLAVGACALLFNVAQSVELAQWMRFLLGALLGVGVYFLLLLVVFSLRPEEALMLALAHALLWLMFRGLVIAITVLEASRGASSTLLPTPMP